jgi:hypothetical protein
MKWTYAPTGVYLCEGGKVVKQWTDPVTWAALPNPFPGLTLGVGYCTTLQEAKDTVEAAAWLRMQDMNAEGEEAVEKAAEREKGGEPG